MKTYVEFYQYGIDWKNTGIKPIVPILGSRLNRSNMIYKAKELARNNFKAGCIIGFKMLRGANILDAKEITDLIKL